ncbi:MAG: hypothetical protein RLZZ450_6826 [Pseudomonadota bacterium]|jgi:hypothetical protein
MEAARITGIDPSLSARTFHLGPGRSRLGRALVGKLIDAADYNYGLKQHAKQIEMVCSGCGAPAVHRRPRLMGRRRRANFSAQHRGRCDHGATVERGQSTAAAARHFLLEGHGMPGRDPTDQQGRRFVRCTLQDLLALGRAGTFSSTDVVTLGDDMESLQVFLLAAERVAALDVGKVRAVWGSIQGTECQYSRTIVKLCDTFAFSVASSLVDQEGGLEILPAGIACIALGEVRQGSRGLYLRVDEAARLRLPESVLPSPGRAVRLPERVPPTLPALASAAERASTPLPQNQASPTTLEVSERLTLVPSRRPWRWLERAWTYLRAFWRSS